MNQGFYLIETDRCYYLTGTKKGNRWINLDDPDPEWMSLIWTCLPKEKEILKSTYHKTNPTQFNLK